LAAGCTNQTTNTYQNATGQPFGQNPNGTMQQNGSPQAWDSTQGPMQPGQQPPQGWDASQGPMPSGYQPPTNPFQGPMQPGAPQLGTPEPDISKPVPQPPVAGRNLTLALGNIAITYYSVAASYDSLSLGVDMYFKAKNNGQGNETLSAKLASQVPPWCWQFFSFQNESVTLLPGEERTLHFYASNDEPGQAGFLFDFWQRQDKSDNATANITVYRGTEQDERLAQSAVVYGQVKDNATGKPVAGATVEVNYYSARHSFRAMTDAQGNYAAQVVGIDDLKSFFGSQPLPYKSLDYFITVRQDGYNYFYRDGVAPMRGERLKADVALDASGKSENYSLAWESKVSEPYGFFKVEADDGWNYAVAVQSKHMPELNKPTHFFVFNASTGKQLFAQPVENECWGLSVSKDGKTAAASCHDGYVYALDLSGDATKLRWKEKDSIGVMRREAEVSHNGKYVLTGPERMGTGGYSFALLDSATGSVVSGVAENYDWLRNSKFSSDDSKFVIGASGGVVAMFEASTAGKLWENWVGEFPFVLEMDPQGNTYAVGKGRTLFSFDANGKERWSFRVPDHTPLTGALSADGKRLAFGTGQGWVYYVDTADGSVVWKSHVTAETMGHNGISMSADGSRTAVGGAPQNTLNVFDSKGNILFENTAAENDDPALAQKWSGIGHAVSESTQRGALGTAMSADGKRVLVAYGDDYVREFEIG